MRTATGNLTLLGNSTCTGKVRTYSAIEIGDEILNNLRAEEALDNFIKKAFNQNGNTTLFISGRLIVGVKTPNGELYCDNDNFFSQLLFFLGLFITCGPFVYSFFDKSFMLIGIGLFIVLGIVNIILFIKVRMVNSDISSLVKQGARSVGGQGSW